MKAPAVFSQRDIGKTPVTRTTGTSTKLVSVRACDSPSYPQLAEIASEGLKGRVFECNLADLQKDEDQAHRKMKLIVEDVQGSKVLTNFHGMDLTTDKLRSLVRKWQTLIEAHSDVTTTDGYHIRVFVIGFTKRRPNQLRKTSYAQSAQIRQIRKKMMDIVKKEVTTVDLKELVAKLYVSV